MNPQIWWHIARASGIVTWLLITASVVLGILLSTDLLARYRRKAWLLDLHRALGALSVIGVVVHIGALIADSWVQFDIVDVLVPFASAWKPWQVALGVVAFWGLILVEATSLAMKRFPRKVWRAIHLASYATFVAGSLHGTFAGTDAANPVYAWTSIVVSVALMALVIDRIRRSRGVRRGDSAVASRSPSDVRSAALLRGE